jgi:hypothetical protein
MVDPPAKGLLISAPLIMTDTHVGVQLDGSILSILTLVRALTDAALSCLCVVHNPWMQHGVS